MKQKNKKIVKRSLPYQYNYYNSNNSSTSFYPFYLTIPDAKRAGAIDRIENGETKLKLIILFQENMNYIKLTAIPQTYFSRFDRALEYTGKFKYRMTDEMPNILTLYESGSSQEIVVRLSEPYQRENFDILPIFNREMSKVNQNKKLPADIINEWLNKLQYIEEQHIDEGGEVIQNGDKETVEVSGMDNEKVEVKEMDNDEKIEVKGMDNEVRGMVNLRIVFDEEDMNHISPLQRDVLEFLFREYKRI